jgi:hypothetical protein
MDLVLRAVMAWNKPWKGQDLELVEDITRATIGTGLTSSNEWLAASWLLDFGSYLFSDPFTYYLLPARRISCNKCAIFKGLEVILTTRNRTPSLSTTIVHHCIQIFTWQGSAWTGLYAHRAHHRTSSTTMQIHDLQSMLDDVRLDVTKRTAIMMP